MGRFIYPGVQPVEIVDELIAHLRFIVQRKMATKECMVLTIVGADMQQSFWLAPDLPIIFEIDAQASIALEKELISFLMRATYSPAGITLDLVTGSFCSGTERRTPSS